MSYLQSIWPSQNTTASKSDRSSIVCLKSQAVPCFFSTSSSFSSLWASLVFAKSIPNTLFQTTSFFNFLSYFLSYCLSFTSQDFPGVSIFGLAPWLCLCSHPLRNYSSIGQPERSFSSSPSIIPSTHLLWLAKSFTVAERSRAFLLTLNFNALIIFGCFSDVGIFWFYSYIILFLLYRFWHFDHCQLERMFLPGNILSKFYFILFSLLYCCLRGQSSS